MTTEYDVVVIGIGSAGSRVAATAHQGGAKVLGIEGGEVMGGLCILRGCMPTKTLLETAHRAHEMRDAERFGLEPHDPEIRFGVQMDRMRALVERFRKAKVIGIEGAGYELLRGRPEFLDAHTIRLGDQEIRSKYFALCTGSEVRELPVPAAAGVKVLSSDDMFLLEEAPKSMLVLGAGPIALEFAQWLARMGTQVILANRSPLLKKMPKDFGDELHALLSREMTVHTEVKIQRIEQGPQGSAIGVFLDKDGQELRLEADAVLNALGRVPFVDGLGVEALGLDPQRISVDETMRVEGTENVFAAGDVIGRGLILHIANLEGQQAGRNILRRLGKLDGEQESEDPSIPHVEVIFTDPPFASVGLDARAAAERGLEIRTETKRFPQQGRGIVMGAEHGLIQLVADATSGAVLGCQILGPRADDLIHVPTAVMSMGGSVHDMYRMPWYHPTLCEAFIEIARPISQALRAD